MARFCPQCGTSTTPSHRFCPSCGASLEGDAAAKSEPPDRLLKGSRKASGVSVLRITLGVVLGVLVVVFFLPGVFDSDSPSLLGSKNRRSPLVDLAGPQTLVDKPVKVTEDQYLRFEFRLSTPARITVSVTTKRGPAFEVFIMDKSGYEEFDSATEKVFGGQFHHYPDLSGKVTSKAALNRSGNLSAGDYVVLLDNTDFGDVVPPMNLRDDVIEAHVKVTVD